MPGWQAPTRSARRAGADRPGRRGLGLRGGGAAGGPNRRNRPRLGGLHAHGAALITTNVEADRIAAEYRPAAHGFADLVAVPWQDPGAFVRAAERLAGAPAGRLASDGHPAFGLDASEDLIALRLALSAAEQEDLADLGPTRPPRCSTP